jgi:phosphoribosylaminoimidazole-succinocarboxamide synthase
MNHFHFPEQTNFYAGKVRDVYTIKNNWLVVIASNRLSAFDVILPKPIPYKGQVLNQIAAYMLQATADICSNWLLAVPAPQASVGKKCHPFPIEVVVRGNISGHAWREYESGKRILCGQPLPEGLRENDFFPQPIITPATKATEGHDEDISALEIVQNGLASEKEWQQIEAYAFALFERGKKMAAERGLILADTKYEFGKLGNEIYLIDEVHTPDSSRYFYAEHFEEKQAKGEKQKQLSKEFVREWLIENGFMGQPNQVLPEITDAWANTISGRYIELYEKLIGKPFQPQAWSNEQTYNSIVQCLKEQHIY